MSRFPRIFKSLPNQQPSKKTHLRINLLGIIVITGPELCVSGVGGSTGDGWIKSWDLEPPTLAASLLLLNVYLRFVTGKVFRAEKEKVPDSLLTLDCQAQVQLEEHFQVVLSKLCFPRVGQAPLFCCSLRALNAAASDFTGLWRFCQTLPIREESWQSAATHRNDEPANKTRQTWAKLLQAQNTRNTACGDGWSRHNECCSSVVTDPRALLRLLFCVCCWPVTAGAPYR